MRTSFKKNNVNMNQVLINGNKLHLAPIKGLEDKEIFDNINEKKRKVTALLKHEKSGGYRSLGGNNVGIKGTLKLSSNVNLFKIKNRLPYGYDPA